MKLPFPQLFFLVFSTALAGGPVYSIEGSGPTAVVLLYFRGTGVENGAFLEWETATEFGTAGFMLERAGSAQGPFTPLVEIGLIPAEGDGITGARYTATDTTAVAGHTYWYILVELETDNSMHRSDAIEVQAGQTPTNTPTATNTPTPTNTPTATNTPPVPAATLASASATSTPTPAATPTMTATAWPTTAVTATMVLTLPPATANPSPTPTATPGQTPVAGLPTPRMTPTGVAAALIQPSPAAVSETGYPAATPELAVSRVIEATPPSEPLIVEVTDAVGTPSGTPTGWPTPTPGLAGGDLVVIGATDGPFSPGLDPSDGSASTFGEAFEGRSFVWPAVGATLLILMAGAMSFAFLYYGRRYKGSGRL
jgi:hypothetical protein